MGGGGNLWYINDCLYTSKLRGAEFMLFLDADEFLDIGPFISLAALGAAYDAVTFSSVSYSFDICVGGKVNVGDIPVGIMQCRKPQPDCSGELSRYTLRGLEQHCLGPRG